MSEIENQIIVLIEQGWSYKQIQEHLQVSSKTIAAARKANFPILESNNSKLSINTFQQYPLPSPTDKTTPGEINPIINPTPKQKKMTTNDEYCDDEGSESKYEVEKLRLQLTHELEMEKIKASKEEKEREYDLREQELELKRNELEASNRKAEEQKRSLLYRIKVLFESCEDGEYSFEEAEIKLNEARKVLSECDEFCFINGFTFQGTASHSILTRVISILNDFLKDMDEDDSEDLEFDASFKRQVSRANFQTF